MYNINLGDNKQQGYFTQMITTRFLKRCIYETGQYVGIENIDNDQLQNT